MKPAPVPSARNIMIIGAASGAGAPDPASAEGPDALRRYQVFHDTPLQHVAMGCDPARAARGSRTRRCMPSLRSASGWPQKWRRC